MKKYPESCVYWIHLPEHTDMFTEGYVGVSVKGLKWRFNQHKNFAKSGGETPFCRAIRKYGDKLVATEIVRASPEYCRELELKLRPEINTGWNLCIGGTQTQLGQVRSEEVKQKFRDMRKGTKFSEKTKAAAVAKLKSMCPWEFYNAKQEIWAIADKFYEYWLKNPKHGRQRVGRAFNVDPEHVRKIIENFSNGWKPLEDKKWLIFSSKVLTPDILEIS